MAEQNAPFVFVDKATGLPAGIIALTSHANIAIRACNSPLVGVNKPCQRLRVFPIYRPCHAAILDYAILIIGSGKACSGKITFHGHGNQVIGRLSLSSWICIRVIPPVFLLSGPRRCLCQILFILRLVTINLAVLDKSVFLIFISETTPGNHTVHYAAISDRGLAGGNGLFICCQLCIQLHAGIVACKSISCCHNISHRAAVHNSLGINHISICVFSKILAHVLLHESGKTGLTILHRRVRNGSAIILPYKACTLYIRISDHAVLNHTRFVVIARIF